MGSNQGGSQSDNPHDLDPTLLSSTRQYHEGDLRVGDSATDAEVAGDAAFPRPARTSPPPPPSMYVGGSGCLPVVAIVALLVVLALIVAALAGVDVLGRVTDLFGALAAA